MVNKNKNKIATCKQHKTAICATTICIIDNTLKLLLKYILDPVTIFRQQPTTTKILQENDQVVDLLEKSDAAEIIKPYFTHMRHWSNIR
jgi:hypothetical protein